MDTKRRQAPGSVRTPAILLLSAALLVAGTAYGFEISYDFGEGVTPEAELAAEYAAELWSGWVTNSASGDADDLEVALDFQPLGSGVLGQAGSKWIRAHGSEALVPSQYLMATGTDPVELDAEIIYSSDHAWYFGTDGGVGGSEFDLVTVLAHEIGHLMGMLDSYDENEGDWGFKLSPTQWYLTRWDAQLRDQDGDAPVAKPGPEYFDEVGTITYVGSDGVAAYGGPIPIYAPDPFQPGSSLAHVDPSLPGQPLMEPGISPGVAKHGIYDLEVGIYTDLGWDFITPSEVHAFGNGSHLWNNGAAYVEGLPPVATTDVYLDAAGSTAYAIAVQKDATVASVEVNNPGRLNVEAGVLTVTGAMVINNSGRVKLDGGDLAVGSLSMTGSARLDVNDRSMVIDYTGSSPLSIIEGYIINGRAGGSWGGTGISSTQAALDAVQHGVEMTAVGSVQNDHLPLVGLAAYTTFMGVPVDGTSILLDYTYQGDANLDGVVDGTDYFLIDLGFLGSSPVSGWLGGDFTYDGVVDATDYFLIDTAFLLQGLFPIEGAPLPEPLTAAVMALGLVGLLRRRRQ